MMGSRRNLLYLPTLAFLLLAVFPSQARSDGYDLTLAQVKQAYDGTLRWIDYVKGLCQTPNGLQMIREMGWRRDVLEGGNFDCKNVTGITQSSGNQVILLEDGKAKMFIEKGDSYKETTVFFSPTQSSTNIETNFGSFSVSFDSARPTQCAVEAVDIPGLNDMMVGEGLRFSRTSQFLQCLNEVYRASWASKNTLSLIDFGVALLTSEDTRKIVLNQLMLMKDENPVHVGQKDVVFVGCEDVKLGMSKGEIRKLFGDRMSESAGGTSILETSISLAGRKFHVDFLFASGLLDGIEYCGPELALKDRKTLGQKMTKILESKYGKPSKVDKTYAGDAIPKAEWNLGDMRLYIVDGTGHKNKAIRFAYWPL